MDVSRKTNTFFLIASSFFRKTNTLYIYLSVYMYTFPTSPLITGIVVLF